MITIKIITLIFIGFFTLVFLSNGIPALIICKKESPRGFFPNWMLVLGGVSTFIMMLLCLILMLDNINNRDITKPTYEPVNEQLYKQIK